MLQVSPLRDNAVLQFTQLFGEYYKELGCPDDTAHLVDEYILPDVLAGIIKIDVLQAEGEYAGFVIYQIDDVTNDWNFKEGWGDVREIYVKRALRGKGYGKFLLYTAEMKLKESGAKTAYCLPCAQAESFFTACGYKKTEEYCDDLDCPVYEKTDLNNCGCK